MLDDAILFLVYKPIALSGGQHVLKHVDRYFARWLDYTVFFRIQPQCQTRKRKTVREFRTLMTPNLRQIIPDRRFPFPLVSN